eukprot:9101816-Karenia_brevis.AAC.1
MAGLEINAASKNRLSEADKATNALDCRSTRHWEHSFLCIKSQRLPKCRFLVSASANSRHCLRPHNTSPACQLPGTL